MRIVKYLFLFAYYCQIILNIFRIYDIISISMIKNYCFECNFFECLSEVTMQGSEPLHPLITRDPISGDELIVTRLECPSSRIVIEGRFSVGWLGRLSREQLDFVELLLQNRGNVQRLAGDLDIAYNTARTRLDEIVTALGGTPENDGRIDRKVVLDRLAAKEISVEEAMRLLKS
jgi:hypothetical protein